MPDVSAEETALLGLSRLGPPKGGKTGTPRLSLARRPGEDTAPRGTTRHVADSLQTRKRRFVRDGDVPVEHHTLNRGPARTTVSHNIETLDPSRQTREVDELKLARDIAERRVHELEAAQRSLETRLGHAEMLVTELKQTVATRDLELADRTSELAQERLAGKAAVQEIRNLRQQIRLATEKSSLSEPVEEDRDENGQQPVKWWKD